MAKQKKPQPVELDKDNNVKPLKHDALVRLKNKFRARGQTYEPLRFGTRIPAGTVLPRTALILDDRYAGPDVVQLASKAPLSVRPSTLPKEAAQTSVTPDMVDEDEKDEVEEANQAQTTLDI